MKLQVMAEFLSAEEVAGIKEGFQLMDTSNNGKINLEELKIGLNKLDHHIPNEDLQILMEAVSVKISIFPNNYIYFFHRFTIRVINFCLAKKLFQGDVDGDGFLDYGEFVAISVHLRKMGNDEHLLRKAFEFFDQNQSGLIEMEELRDALSDEFDRSEDVIHGIMHDVDTDKVLLIFNTEMQGTNLSI